MSLDEAALPPLLTALHVAFIKHSAEETGTMESEASQHLRLNAVYWGLCCLELLGAPAETLDRAALRAWLLACQREGRGFAPAPGHDPHLLCTLSALQVLALLRDPLLRDPGHEGWRRALGEQVAALQQEDGSFVGDAAGEVDTRFSFAALAALELLRQPLGGEARARAAAFVRSCGNFDGGFGATPGGESHAGQIFTALAALRLAQPAQPLCADGGGALGAWLAARQLACGGLNGRPEKQPDVCYSWWVLSSLALLRRRHWVEARALAGFILEAQDGEKGGIADRGEDEADVYHTFFGVAGLALLGYPGLAKVDPVFALPEAALEWLGLAPFG